MKRLLVLLILLALLIGVPYGLARMGVIPVAKLTSKSPALQKFARAAGLLPRKPVVNENIQEERQSPSSPAASASVPPPPTPASETAQALLMPSPASRPAAGSSSRQIGWMAKVYEEMEPEQAVRILERLSDREVVALLRRMKQRQVAQILALLPPDRAARLSRALMIQQ
ncbi:MAG: hypothetical protein RMM06_03360 [Armatimonadota bacterium]|nr:hypothetical protein [bacterium]MCS7308829.1 hypothetical protein [Armatimonadota bacterium]MDW8103721.1 hypothetical protein [Armatimonadota bacterium]MDW8289732.1 hypothetical protein [Armatimonadota bacterium]